jgi:hypothetical protein
MDSARPERRQNLDVAQQVSADSSTIQQLDIPASSRFGMRALTP